MQNNKRKWLRWSGFAALLVAAIVFWSLHAEALAGFPRGIYETEVPVGVEGTLTLPSFAIAIAVTWDKGLESPTGSLRVRDGADWGPWEDLQMDEDAANGPSPRAGSRLRFGTAITAVQYRLDTHGAQAAHLAAFDGQDHQPFLARVAGTIHRIAHHIVGTAVAQSSVPAVIGRADWGADESLRKRSDGTAVWPEEYAPVSTFIVHHTAGSDGTPDLATAKSVVRGIYQYHAVSLGWGDIGYNYLIDTVGNVFEGRFGGDGTVGGHAYREAACSSKGVEASFNAGSVGIAFLGSYESFAPTAAANTALSNLIGSKAHDLGLDPSGNSYFVDATYPTVIAHRDVDCTTCPGNAEYANLPTIRSNASAFAASLPPLPTPVRAAAYLAQSATLVTARVGEAATLTVDMRNDSNVTWRSYVADRPQLLFNGAAGSPLQHSSWRSATIAAELATPNVPPGGTGRFVLTLTAPSNAVDTVGNFAAAWGGTTLPGTDFSVTMRSTGLPYEGVVTNSNIPATVFAGGSRFITLFYQNLGVNSWSSTDVRLAITSAAGTPNVFRTSSWPTSARFPLTETVATNAITKISVPIQIPNTLGVRTWSVWLVRANGTEIPGSRQRYTTRIDSTSQFQLRSETVPVALRVGWRKRVTITLKNSGITTWGSDTVLEIREKGNASTFVDPSWPSVLGRIRFSESRVTRGGTGTFTFYLKTPRSLGVHRLEFSLVSRTVPTRIYQGMVVLPVRVDP